MSLRTPITHPILYDALCTTAPSFTLSSKSLSSWSYTCCVFSHYSGRRVSLATSTSDRDPAKFGSADLPCRARRLLHMRKEEATISTALTRCLRLLCFSFRRLRRALVSRREYLKLAAWNHRLFAYEGKNVFVWPAL
jgi:hypothetical protein